jgi:hypothetical protein
MQTLDTRHLVPLDMVLFLGNIPYFLAIVGDLESEELEEYDGIIYPSFDIILLRPLHSLLANPSILALPMLRRRLQYPDRQPSI